MRFSGEPFGVESMYMILNKSGRKETRELSFSFFSRSMYNGRGFNNPSTLYVNLGSVQRVFLRTNANLLFHLSSFVTCTP